MLGGSAGKRLDLHLARQSSSSNGRGNFEYSVAVLGVQFVFVRAFGKREGAGRAVSNLPGGDGVKGFLWEKFAWNAGAGTKLSDSWTLCQFSRA